MNAQWQTDQYNGRRFLFRRFKCLIVTVLLWWLFVLFVCLSLLSKDNLLSPLGIDNKAFWIELIWINVFNSRFYYNLSHLERDISWSWRWRHSGIQISHLLPGQTASLVWNHQGKCHLCYHIQRQNNCILGKFRCAVSSRVHVLFCIYLINLFYDWYYLFWKPICSLFFFFFSMFYLVFILIFFKLHFVLFYCFILFYDRYYLFWARWKPTCITFFFFYI